ncbi:MAG TPA: lysozyme inhibitor LprI family protein [Allosphingosinicella sp.]
MISLMMAAALLGAQEPDCRTAETQADMNRCAYLDFQAADRELNQLWPQMVALARESDRELGPDFDDRPSGEQTLREAQRAWLSFRDGWCTYEGYEARGGSMETMLYEGCRATLTRDRVAQLRRMLDLR